MNEHQELIAKAWLNHAAALRVVAEVDMDTYADVLHALERALQGGWEYRRVDPDGRVRHGATFDEMPVLDPGWTAQRRPIGEWEDVEPTPPTHSLDHMFGDVPAQLAALTIRREGDLAE